MVNLRKWIVGSLNVNHTPRKPNNLLANPLHLCNDCIKNDWHEHYRFSRLADTDILRSKNVTIRGERGRVAVASDAARSCTISADNQLF